jgi:glycerate dehydrogenase
VTLRKIVVLDGHTTNPGDLSWESLAKLGELTVHERTADADVVARLSDAEIALINKVQLTRDILLALPKLRYVGILATGTNCVELQAAHELGIVVCNVPSYSTDSVAQLVFEALLDWSTQAQAHRSAVRAGAWVSAPDFSLNVATLQELAGKTLGIVGYGTIGRRVAEIAHAFAMQVLVAQSLRPDGQPSTDARPARVPLDELLTRSDFVTLHCPLTQRTRSLMGARELGLMKPTAVLINTARGPLIDELALAGALDRGRPIAAYLDVLSSEPPPADHPLLHHAACRITPHIGWTSREARNRLIQTSTDNVAAFLAGTPSNVVGVG